MNKIAKFHKVSIPRFLEDFKDKLGANAEENCYYQIKLPKRATVGSAGYDFFSPLDFTLLPGQEITIPTGICAEIENGYVLMIYPRSGLGFKFKLRLNNTVGIIDSDYFFSDNEGHIMIRMTNCSDDKTLSVKSGEGFAQGIFIPFGITVDDDSNGTRNGGFGSTTKK